MGPQTQFIHTTSERRASTTIVGSLTRSGLYVPQDFIKQNPHDIDLVLDEDDDDDDQDQEYQPLLGSSSVSNSVSTIRYHRPSINIHDEAQLLQVNKIPIRRLSSSISFNSTDRPNTLSNSISSAYGSLLQRQSSNVIEDPEAVEVTWDDALKTGRIGTTPLFELKSLSLSSLPLMITFLLQNSLGVCSVFAVGHISAEALAGITLGTMSANITGFAVIAGLASALDTFLPQAYGAEKYKLVGLLFQRCSALIFVIMFFVCISWWLFAETLLLKVLPDPESATKAALYLKVTSFGIPGYILFETGKRFLQAQSIFDASTYILFVCAPLNALMNYGFVWYFKFGYIGAPIATAITYTLMALGLFGYTIRTKHEANPMKCWNGLTLKKAFSNWSELIKLSIPNLVMIMSEFLSFEILTLLSSYLGTKQLAAQSVVTTMGSLTYQIPYGVSIAASTRIANFLGAQLPKASKIAAKMVFVITIFVAILNSSVLYFFRYPIANCFTNDQEVIEVVATVLPVVALMQIFDALNSTSAGCLRGQGQQKIGGIVNLFSYYLVGLPVGFIMAFYLPSDHPLGLIGLWSGVLLALIIIGFVQSWYVLNADYDKLVADAVRRNNAA